MMRRSVSLHVSFGFVILGLASGCGGESFATVSGTVTFADKPLPGGTVIFQNEAGTKVDRAAIKGDGKYVAERVPYGKVKIAVEPGAKAVNMPKQAKFDKIQAPEGNPGAAVYAHKSENTYVDFPKTYRSVDTSGLTLDVNESKKTLDINMSAKK